MATKLKTASPKPEKAATVATEPTHRTTTEEIQQRAYQKYCARKGAPGDAMQDWLDAERELSIPEKNADSDPVS